MAQGQLIVSLLGIQVILKDIDFIVLVMALEWSNLRMQSFLEDVEPSGSVYHQEVTFEKTFENVVLPSLGVEWLL